MQDQAVATLPPLPLLLNQFHDIIPGSSIGWVYEDAARDYETIERLCEAVAGPARRALVERIGTGAARDARAESDQVES